MNSHLVTANKNGNIVGDLTLIAGIEHLRDGVSLPDKLYSYYNNGPDGQNHTPWETNRLFYAGTREDGPYTFFGYLQKDNTITVMAGCRTFTIGEARAHWRDHSDECDELLDKIQAWGKDLAEKGVAEQPRQKTPDRIPLSCVLEYFGTDGNAWSMFQNWMRFKKGIRIVDGKIEQ